MFEFWEISEARLVFLLVFCDLSLNSGGGKVIWLGRRGILRFVFAVSLITGYLRVWGSWSPRRIKFHIFCAVL
jgi:hypothetical protein